MDDFFIKSPQLTVENGQLTIQLTVDNSIDS